MKNYFLRIFVIAIATIGIFTVQSCNTDPCRNVDCGVNGTCFEGSCICDNGYDGTDCNIIIRSLFTGLYDVEEICDSDSSYTDYYESSINESIEGVQFVTINNIYNFEGQGFDPDDATVLASVSNTGGEYSLLIESQTVTVGFAGYTVDFEISGTGTYDPASTVITLNYSVTNTDLDPLDEGYIDNCVQAYYPQ